MTQKVIHNKKCSDKEKCKCKKIKTRRRRSKTKKLSVSPLIHQPPLPPYSSVIPNPVSAKTNKPYYVETSSIHPDVISKNIKVEVKHEDIKPEKEEKVKEEEKSTPSFTPFKEQMKTEPVGAFKDQEKETRHKTIPTKDKFKENASKFNKLVRPEHQIDIDKELKDIDDAYNNTHSHFSDQYDEPYKTSEHPLKSHFQAWQHARTAIRKTNKNTDYKREYRARKGAEKNKL